MFGLGGLVSSAIDVASDVVEVATLGLVERREAKALLDAGYTIYQISDATGIAVAVLENEFNK